MFLLLLNAKDIYFDSEGKPWLKLQNIAGLLKAYVETFTG